MAVSADPAAAGYEKEAVCRIGPTAFSLVRK
ncbi:1-deoxy-D-xylulose-5-phosphate synthase [Bacillus sp. NRRL B-14911]|nr:1-deoxy-D-xylulose-5-phosphate synthase [Bacillus sp. NRRL B-14911]